MFLCLCLEMKMGEARVVERESCDEEEGRRDDYPLFFSSSPPLLHLTPSFSISLPTSPCTANHAPPSPQSIRAHPCGMRLARLRKCFLI